MIAEEIARASKPEPEAVKVTADQLRNIILQEVSKTSDKTDVITEDATKGLSDKERAKVLRWFVDAGLDSEMSVDDKKLVVKYSPEMQALSSVGAPKGVADVLAALKKSKKSVGLGSAELAGRALNPRNLGDALPELPASEKVKTSTKLDRLEPRGSVKINR